MLHPSHSHRLSSSSQARSGELSAKSDRSSSRPVVTCICAAILSLAAGQAIAANGVVDGAAEGAGQTSLAGLRSAYPGLTSNDSNGRLQLVAGVPMLPRATADDAASAWLAQYDTIFGAGRLDLQLRDVTPVRDGKFIIYSYDQTLEGVPVEFSNVKVRVMRSDPIFGADPIYEVVKVGAKVASMPEGAFKAVSLTGEDAQARVRALPQYKTLPLWSAPQMVVYQGEGDFSKWITPTLVWKFEGEMPVSAFARKFTFLVDASTGELIHARNEILHVAVTGQVRARATPTGPNNATADHAGNLPTDQVVPNIRVRINGSNANSAFTDALGNFTIPWAGTTPVTVDASVGDGRWVRVIENLPGQALMTASATATPGTPVTLNLNPGPGSQYTNAQVNAFIHQNSTHDFFKRYAPAFTGLDTQLPANTTVTGSCNAFYNGTSTNYYAVGGSCNNTAFSSVVAHEYGHHIVNRLALAQGGFGEGFGDTMSILQYDDLVVGRYFSTSGGAVRTPDSTNRQYPCDGCGVHASGEVLGGVICEIRKSLAIKYGTSISLETLRQMHMEWALDTLGGDGNDSASPRTLTEYLVANDDDGNLNNGTPDYCQVAGAFAQHNIIPPGGSGLVAFGISPAIPALLPPSTSTRFTVTFGGLCRLPVANTAQFFYRTGTNPFTPGIITATSSNVYTVQIVTPSCGEGRVEFYFRTNTTNIDGTPATQLFFPSVNNGITPQPFSVAVASNVINTTDDFESDRGWTVGPTTAVTGAWVRVDPNGTNNGSQVQPADDHSPSGILCFVTGQGTSATAVGEADVDAGLTTLVSPIYNLSAASDATISYFRWYSNGFGAGPYADTFRVDVSVNGGSTWTNAETIGPASSPETNGGWRLGSFTLSNLSLAPTANVRVRFIAEDAGIGSLVEAAIDDFAIAATVCDDAAPCRADYDQSGAADGADVEVFFNLWSAGDFAADFNDDGGVDGADVAAFFNAWSAGC